MTRFDIIKRFLSQFSFLQRFSAWRVSKTSAFHNKAIASHKERLFSGINNGVVLEIGPGSGLNLPYFPKNVEWIGIEPNVFMNPYLFKKAGKLNHGFQVINGFCEHLPLKDNSVDAVVSTIVLCSVKDLNISLKEIIRVLKPGGEFIFIEHVAAPDGTWLRKIQGVFCPVWKFLGDGCHPDRDIGLVLENSGFEDVEYEHFMLPLPISIEGPHIAGKAKKRTDIRSKPKFTVLQQHDHKYESLKM